MVGYGDEMFNQLLQAERYISFVSLFLLAFGVVFELPLVMMLLAWARIVDYKACARWRKYAILVEAVIAMVLTPSQDPVSMALMLIPLIVLYEFGILLAQLRQPKRKGRRRSAAVGARRGGQRGDRRRHRRLVADRRASGGRWCYHRTYDRTDACDSLTVMVLPA